METYLQEEGERSPYILLEPTGKLLLKGRSFPDDASKVYEPVLRWLEAYKKDPASSTVFTIDLGAFNIGSSKYILYMIYHLQDISGEGKEASIEWVYEEGDEDMIEVGADYEVMARIPFRYRLRTPQVDLAHKATVSAS